MSCNCNNTCPLQAADEQHTAEAAAATDAAAESPKKPQAAAAGAAAQPAAEGATAAQVAAAQQAAELPPASEAAAEEEMAAAQPLAAKPAADAQAVVQTAEAAEYEGAAKVAAEVQAAVDAALMAAQLPTAEAQPAAIKMLPTDAMHLGTDEMAAAPAMAMAVSPADTERWDVDADDDIVCDSDDATQVWLRAVLLHCIMPPPLSNAPQPRGKACKKPKGATVAECNRS